MGFFSRLVLDENVDFLVERKLESEGFDCVRFVEGAEDRDLMESEKSVEELAKSEEYDTLSDEIETLEENLGESYKNCSKQKEGIKRRY